MHGPHGPVSPISQKLSFLSKGNTWLAGRKRSQMAFASSSQGTPSASEPPK